MSLVRKLIPVSLYDIPGLEAWLEEQANQGLFPTQLGNWATFDHSGLPGTRFRLAAQEGKSRIPTLEQLELCRQFGWNYALSFGGLYLFYAVDPEAIELYTDWESRGFFLKSLKKRIAAYRRRYILFYGILAALLIWALFFYETGYDIQPDHVTALPLIFINITTPYALIFLTVVVLAWRDWQRDYHTLKQTCAALSQGLPPPPSPGPRKSVLREKGLTLILLIPLLLCFLFIRFESLNPLLDIPLSRFPGSYVSLQDLEREPVYPWNEIFDPPAPSWAENTADVKLSLLSPVWYSVTQECYSPTPGPMENYDSPDPEGGKNRYAPKLEMTRFHLLIPALAEPIARAKMDDYRLVNLWWEYEEVDYPGLDFVILATARDEPWQMAAVGRGGKVAVFRYAGQERLGDHLETLAEMVQ